MQFDLVKHPGGTFTPAHDIDLERLQRFKNGEMYTAEIKLTRNPAHHRKAFAFFNFCFAHWCANRAGLEHMNEASQFDRFRKDLTILAGFYEQTVRLNGEIRTEAQSLAFSNMDQEQFERCYSALINAAIKHVFGSTKDPNILNQLQSFF
ncbi:DUF1367 family protein [Salmonella enterica subsp. enterica serovar Agona]|uniref:DUF1367 family protein n=1 Tax=Salmonella enterica TaxID=28901 RepID=UPI0010FAD6AD|nr:DUF1367 family protein [Salmonella enterica]EBV0896195.1 hypothetical protein [Salmonella enterica subsp. enterica serovar Agona]EBW7525070.1 hypothetical protein [Salmonella enterica subsp. enterica serovar Agona]MDQ7511001.1 DUF1367 family protein [Salmonella enterica subsp. enterica serovar Agona]TKZ37897.1 DUF1367 family protein [Salmonella enterica subsp. enterica serovar Agona]TKZ39266.1 DUF1367 family protein [Salmonella enterica subsp. enterica serovar Agona]